MYEINGLFWRDPYDPFWTHGGGHHGGGHHGGWMHDSLEIDTVNGTAIVDTTFFNAHYYLDEDNDGAPDYFLNFGPPWYQPPSGATRPNDGDPVDIVGGRVNRITLPMIIVFEINGQVWRDTTGWIGHNPGGGWIHHNMFQAQHIPTPFDPEDWMHVTPGWHTGGMMMPESLFCEMEEIFPENLPNTGNENAFAAYEIGLFREDGSNMLSNQGGMGGHIQFGNEVQFQLHYNEIQLQGFNINENSIQVKYWNQQSNSWVVINNATLNPLNNTVTFSNSTVSSHLMLTGTENPLSIEDGGTQLPTAFTLKQNYPNPFNPETTIEYILQKDAHVALLIYNVLGQKMFELVNGNKAAGVYKVRVDGRSLPSGIYFYKLEVDGRSQLRKMNLNK
ncbi:MAG: T9SS type A sorting domain-containing protein [Aliifodinibius sp.]|nr:T9SS type A sorting domain-containing protein [Fodinibius sp.]NIY26718.1 T9SS type A sorting domain-containing protein [Fodinibius sp.]